MAAEPDASPLPPGFAGLNLSLDQISGRVNSHMGYEGFAYQGANLLFGGTGQMSFTYGRNQALVGDGLPTTAAAATGNAEAWSLKLATDPKQQAGLRYQVQFTDVDKDFQGGSQFAFGAEMAGVRQSDFAAGWSSGQLAFDMGRERLADKQTGLGLGRQSMAASAYGFNYQSDRVTIDADATFGSALNQRVLGKDGYNLGQRKLGTARAGYNDLTALGGLSDVFQSMGFAHRDLSLQMTERELTQGGSRLVDRQQQVRYGGLTVTQTRRSMDAGFTGYAAAGYGDWRSLVGGREDATTAAFTSKRLQANYNHSRLYANPRQLEGQGTLTVTSGYRLAASPAQWASLSYQRDDSQTGREDLWTEAPDQLVATRQDRYALGLTFDAHKLAVGLRDYRTMRPNQSLSGREMNLGYTHGKRTNLQYLERTERKGVTAEEETTTTVTRMQRLSLETAFGLTALHERTTGVSDEPEQHDRVRFDRSFGPRYEIKAGYESWEQTADRQYTIAGYRNLLARPANDAEAFDVSVTVRPGTAEVSVWHRSLLWTQDEEVGDWAEGGHRLTETGVRVQQAIVGDFGLKGTWTRFDRDRDMDLDRREVALVLAPAGTSGFRPSAEVGYRELRNAEGETRPSLYASATVQPYDQLQLKASLQHQQQETGAAAVLSGWDTIDRRTVSLSATHGFGKDGKAEVVYADTPLAPSGRPAGDDTLLRSQDLTVGVSTPTNWILPGLRLTGKYHSRSTPAYGDALDKTLTEHEAGLSWSNGDLSSLTATYTLSKDLLGSTKRGESRFEFEFNQQLDAGKLAVTGYVHDIFDLDLRRRREDERYRFGVNYSVPF